MKKLLPILSLMILILLNFSCKKDSEQIDCTDCIELNAEVSQICTNDWMLVYQIDSLWSNSYADNIPTSFLVEGKNVKIKFKPASGGFTCEFIAVPLSNIELFDIQEL